MTKPNFGLVGCGAWGRLILRDLRALGCPVVAVVRSPESRARALEGGARAVEEVEQLAGVDAVIVATPTAVHAATVEAVLPLGVPVFVEKVIALDRAHATSLATRAADRLFVMNQWRYHAAVEALRDIVRGGEIGELTGVRVTWTSWRRVHRDVDAIWVQVPHPLAILQELIVSLPEPIVARADRDRGEITGLTAVLGESPWALLDISARAALRTRRVEAIGRDGIALMDGAAATHVTRYNGTLTSHPSEPTVGTTAAAGTLPLARQLAAYVAYLAGGPAPRGSATDGVAVTDMILRLRDLAGIEPQG